MPNIASYGVGRWTFGDVPKAIPPSSFFLFRTGFPAVEKELGYFVNNVARMRYGTFRRQGFFIGSGVVEAGCKTVIGARGKQSGMFWGKPGAENILALRSRYASRRLDQFWKDRLNARAARNDCLRLAA